MTLPLVFPPSSLPTFLATGHGIELGDDYAGVKRGSGHSRKRPTSTGRPRIVSVAWLLNEAQMTALDDWFENALVVGANTFTAEVANQGPGQLFWEARWVEPYTSDPQATPQGLLWTVTGRIQLFGEGEAARPLTGDMAAEIDVAMLGSGSLVLPDTPLAAEIIVALEQITPLLAEIRVALLSTSTPLSAEILVALDGSGSLVPGSGSSGFSMTVEEEDAGPSQTDPPALIFPNGSLTVDSDGAVHVAFSGGITIQEDDGSPSVAASLLVLPSGTVTVDSEGAVHYRPPIWSKGSTAPLIPIEGDEWLDDVNGIQYRYYNDGSSSQWVEF